MTYALVDLVTDEIVSPEAPSLANILTLGLSTDDLADLTDRGYPGVGCWPVVDLPPPSIDPLTHRLADRTYTVDVPARQVVGAHSVVARSISEIRADLRRQAEAKRYAAETGGITVGGAAVKTDRESQALLTGAAAALSAGLPGPINWKAVNGWVQLGPDDVTALATAVAAHVQRCFSREKALCEQIDAATDATELASIDLSVGWTFE